MKFQLILLRYNHLYFRTIKFSLVVHSWQLWAVLILQRLAEKSVVSAIHSFYVLDIDSNKYWSFSVEPRVAGGPRLLSRSLANSRRLTVTAVHYVADSRHATSLVCNSTWSWQCYVDSHPSLPVAPYAIRSQCCGHINHWSANTLSVCGVDVPIEPYERTEFGCSRCRSLGHNWRRIRNPLNRKWAWSWASHRLSVLKTEFVVFDQTIETHIELTLRVNNFFYQAQFVVLSHMLLCVTCLPWRIKLVEIQIQCTVSKTTWNANPEFFISTLFSNFGCLKLDNRAEIGIQIDYRACQYRQQSLSIAYRNRDMAIAKQAVFAFFWKLEMGSTSAGCSSVKHASIEKCWREWL